MSEPSDQLRVRRERRFSPHHLLIGAARAMLEDAEKEIPGWTYFQLATITFSALAVEALVNSFGNRLMAGKWRERDSPHEKLRAVLRILQIPESDISWRDIDWLIEFRHRIAHAKPELVSLDEKMSRGEYDKLRFEHPKSLFEKDICLDNSKRALQIVEKLFLQLCQKMPPDELEGLLCDSYSGEISRAED